MVAASMLLCHNSLMRSGELLSGLKVSDFEWSSSEESVTIHLARSKAHRRGGAEYIRVHNYPGRSAYTLLLAWFDAADLWGHHDLQVLPRVVKGRGGVADSFDFTLPATSWCGGVSRSAAAWSASGWILDTTRATRSERAGRRICSSPGCPTPSSRRWVGGGPMPRSSTSVTTRRWLRL